MGLKSGSRDAGLDESEDSDERSIEEEETEADEIEDGGGDAAGDAEITGPTPSETDPNTTTETMEDTESTAQRPAMSSIPYKLRREKVNEGREQVPYFLREEVIDAEDELQDTLEELLGEDVYKSDYREASMVAAQRNPELVAEILREWGYDLDAA